MAVMDEIEELKRMEDALTDWPDKKIDIEFAFLAPEATKVFLAGSFNNWETGTLPMRKNRKGQWKTSVKLLPGRYEYKYFVDGSWVIDKQCPDVIPDAQGAVKCVIDVAPKMAA